MWQGRPHGRAALLRLTPTLEAYRSRRARVLPQGRHSLRGLSDSPEKPDLGLQIWLQTQQASNLGGFGVDDASPHKICRIRINFFKERRTKPNDLRNRDGSGGQWTGHRKKHSSPTGLPEEPEAVPPPWERPQAGLTLALVISVSIGCFALKMFCTSCWGLVR